MCSDHANLHLDKKARVVTQLSQTETPQSDLPNILHVCKREMVRPLRDQILRISGFRVDSTLSAAEALAMYSARDYALLLIDVEGERGIPEAEQLCSEVKTAQRDQLVAFVCNWRVAILTDCPDEIVRTEFDPAAFVAGVRGIVEAASARRRARNHARAYEYAARPHLATSSRYAAQAIARRTTSFAPSVIANTPAASTARSRSASLNGRPSLRFVRFNTPVQRPLKMIGTQMNDSLR